MRLVDHQDTIRRTAPGPSAGKMLRTLLLLMSALAGAGLSARAAAQPVLEDIGFVSLPGDRFQIELEFNEIPPQPEVFVIESPARLSMDFPGVESRLDQRRFPLDFSGADSVMVLEAQERTRMVVNLSRPTAHATQVTGNRLVVTVGDDAGEAGEPRVSSAGGPDNESPQSEGAGLSASDGDIRAIDFRRGEDGAGELVIDLADRGLVGDVERSARGLQLSFRDADLADRLQMRLDVSDFATPVRRVDVYEEDGDTLISAEMAGEYDYIAYQSGGRYILSVTPMDQAEAEPEELAFTGERISLNFQDIDVRSVLQILADFNDFSLVVSDTVSGSITLRLEDVPWDQALDLVLRARGLDQRRVGEVLYIAPAEEIASAELQQLENRQQAEALAPLQTEYMEINYAVAADLLALLQGEGGQGAQGDGGRRGGILSSRGRARVDARTNTLIVQDVADKIEEVRNLVQRLDVPVRQVLIEARIVNANTSFSEALGVRWGGVHTVDGTGDQFILGDSIETVGEESNNIAAYNQEIAQAIIDGTSPEEAQATILRERANGLAVDLGVDSASASSFALGYLGDNGLLQLELSALESSGNGEVIAQPKVATQDKQLARIESGVQVPYQAQAGGTAGGSTTEFVPAVLSLEVTPQVTPDNRIIMLLDIHQDSVTSSAGAVPAIATNSVTTRVLVNDGETVVLGGVFREELTTTVTKTPVLGDIPYLGRLFKHTEDQETKTELLIFITPSILNEAI